MSTIDIFLKTYSRSMREATRRYRRRKLLVAQRKPLTGIYWWVPVPGGRRGSVQWTVAAYHEDIYGEVMHNDIWSQVLELLQLKWPKFEMVPGLEDAYAALPRGRVTQMGRSQYNLYHGGDSPGDIGLVRNQFNFVGGASNKEVFDDHEQIIREDLGLLQQALGVKLGL